MTSTPRAADKPATAPSLTFAQFPSRARRPKPGRHAAGRWTAALVVSIALVAAAVAPGSAAATPSAGLLASPFVSADGTVQQPFFGHGQRLLIPAYFSPSDERWTKMCARLGNRGLTSVIVMNPGDSGVFDHKEQRYTDAIDLCHDKGQQVIGYVDTAYGARALDGLSGVKRNVDAYYSFYPAVDGIFLDQMNSHENTKKYYAAVRNHVRLKKPHNIQNPPLVVGNQGAGADNDWPMSTVTILVNFEGPDRRFASDPPDDAMHHLNPFVEWTAPKWVSAYSASRFGQLVYRVRTARNTRAACRRSRNQHGGWIYVTNDNLTNGILNPWDRPPIDRFLACRTLNRPPAVDPGP